MEPLERLGQRGFPQSFPIGELLVRDCIPKFGLHALLALHIKKPYGCLLEAHSIITSAFSLVLSSSKKHFSPFSKRDSTTW
jgi:hypothetical protein